MSIFSFQFFPDIDECKNISCPGQQICENTIGSYLCSCPQPGDIVDSTNATLCKGE